MNTNKSKAHKIRLKTNDSIEHLHQKPKDYLFRPIASANDLSSQRKPPSPFQTGLKYLKLLGQLKRQTETNSIDPKSTILDRLERTSAFSTNYYAPLPPLSSHVTNKSIQVDDFDELSYKTARNHSYSYLSFSECFFTCLSLLIFIFIIFYLQLNSSPLHCLLHKKFWYPIDLSNGFTCEHTNINIHYVEIYSQTYQLEIQKNIQSMSCLGFNILSCLPIDYLLIPKRQIIRRNNQLIKYCNSTDKIICHNHSLSILPYEYKWNYKNEQSKELIHCSCLTYSNNTNCFHFMIIDQCDLQIPWFDYCLKYSTTHSTCQAYIKK